MATGCFVAGDAIGPVELRVVNRDGLAAPVGIALDATRSRDRVQHPHLGRVLGSEFEWVPVDGRTEKTLRSSAPIALAAGDEEDRASERRKLQAVWPSRLRSLPIPAAREFAASREGVGVDGSVDPDRASCSVREVAGDAPAGPLGKGQSHQGSADARRRHRGRPAGRMENEGRQHTRRRRTSQCQVPENIVPMSNARILVRRTRPPSGDTRVESSAVEPLSPM